MEKEQHMETWKVQMCYWQEIQKLHFQVERMWTSSCLTHYEIENQHVGFQRKSIKNRNHNFWAPEVFLSNGNNKTTPSNIYAIAMVVYKIFNRVYEYPWKSVFGIGVDHDLRPIDFQMDKEIVSYLAPLDKHRKKWWQLQQIILKLRWHWKG